MSHPQKHIGIAVIDDDEFFCRSLQARFSTHGYMKVELACNSGAEFFRQYMQHPIHLVLLDIAMPQRNGVEVMRELRERKIELPVFVFSNLLYKEYVDQLLELGVKHCIRKGPLEVLEQHISEYFNIKENRNHTLSPEEFKMLISICNEKHLDQIADTMNKGVDVIKKRKASLARKLSIKNNDLQFLKWAIRNGYYDVG
jgi:DNA-binding NarL/FixJ family response regulator